MTTYQGKGVRYGKHSKKFVRALGGIAFLDRLNDALLTVTEADVRAAARGMEVLTLAGHELEFLGSGVFRNSFLLGGSLVVKFPRRENIKDNVKEWEIYLEAVRVGLQKNFAACVALLDGWTHGPVTVYEYLPGHDTWNSGAKMQLRLTKKFSSRGASIEAHDLHGGNVRGEKVIDYGLFRGQEEQTHRTMKEVSPSRKYLIAQEPAW